MDALKQRLYRVDAIDAAISLMDWDQQTYMPHGGGDARAEQVGILSGMAHAELVSQETQRAWEAASQNGADEDGKALLRIVRRKLDLATKIPGELVARKSTLAAKGHDAWMQARTAGDFSLFEPVLTEMVAICSEEAQCLGYSEHPYDALTDMYEEGATAKGWQAMFDGIRAPLVALVQETSEAPQIDDSMLRGTWDEAKQAQFTAEVVAAIGFDMERGRQDTAPHPFCTNFSVNDVRLTNRYNSVLTSSLYTALHEAGHGLYEQNSPVAWDRTPLAGGVSLGVHESQSRTWENIVGRSRAFWSWCYPRLRAAFPALPDVGEEALFRAVNRVEPSLIRVEADEVTYNLHVMVRFELECDMVAGKLAVKDLPEAWNEKYRSYLGIVPNGDADGCLQDVHWSGGMIGYFPTYSMGNILGYQIWARLMADLGDVEAAIARGDFAPVLDWLREKVYRHGSKYKPTELIERVCGQPLDPKDYLAGITTKYRSVYGLEP